MIIEIGTLFLATPTITPLGWQLHKIGQFIMIHLHDRAIDETIAGIVTSRILRSLDKFFGSFESKIDIDVATEKLRLFPLLIHITGAKHEDAGGLVRPLLLQFVLDNLAV